MDFGYCVLIALVTVLVGWLFGICCFDVVFACLLGLVVCIDCMCV